MAVGETRKQGIKCRVCGCRHFYTVATWHTKNAHTIRRRKKCRHCGNEVFTTEKADEK